MAVEVYYKSGYKVYEFSKVVKIGREAKQDNSEFLRKVNSPVKIALKKTPRSA